jgi:ubiquitin-protein ligase
MLLIFIEFTIMNENVKNIIDNYLLSYDNIKLLDIKNNVVDTKLTFLCNSDYLYIITDFNLYCYCDNNNTNFNLNIISKEKNIINILDELILIFKIYNYYDGFHIYNNIEEFTKYKIDYELLESTSLNIKSNSNSIINIPNNLLLSKKQIIKLLINEIKYINRNKNYEHYIIPDNDNIFILSLKMRVKNIIMELKIILDNKMYPYMPPKIEYIAPKIKIDLLLSIINLNILKIKNWNCLITLEYLIINLASCLEPYIDNNLLDDIQYSILNKEIIKLISLTENNIMYDINIPIPNNNNNNNNNNNIYWKSGTGYGYNELQNWNINSYIEQQEIYNSQIIDILININKEINYSNTNEIINSCLIKYIYNEFNTLTILELEKNLLKYIQIFNILSNLIDKDISQLFIDNTSILLNDLYNNLILLINSNDENILQIYCICEWYIYNSTKINNNLLITEYENDIDKFNIIMKENQFNIFELSNKHLFYKHINEKIEQKSKIRMLSEIANFKSNLPINWESTIWVCISKTHFNIFSFIISGPKNTPYENGLFEFHAYFPPNYPNSVPHVLLNLNKSFRFNPNLYDSGKVCLSLLGTWAGESGETWNPKTSTFLQVMISIQSLILIDEPYFNEPGYEKNINTTEGHISSKEYNENIEPKTIELGMIDMIKNPPNGFENVVKEFFKLKKNEIINNTLQWENRNKKVTIYRKELLKLLNKL